VLTRQCGGDPDDLGRGVAEGSQKRAKVKQWRSQVIIIVISVFVMKLIYIITKININI
jgi:hypothetical protein